MATPLLIGLILGAVVVWALRPYTVFTSKAPRSVAIASPSAAASPLESPQTQLSPSAQPLRTPAAVTTPVAIPSLPNASGARVAIIIDDCGQWVNTEREYIALPIPLTLSILPHLKYTQQIAQEASADGKGVMLHLPMEPLSHANPGPGEITTAMSDVAVAAQTTDDLAQVPTARGVNNHEGSEATADPRVMRDVIAVVKQHGLFFIDSRTSAQSVAAQTAHDAGVPSASRDVFLDNQADVAYAESMLERTVEIAGRNGSAIAIGHPKATTFAALQAMYPAMQAAGVRFVLASELVR